jgi:hypothetical protein
MMFVVFFGESREFAVCYIVVHVDWGTVFAF